MEGWAVGVDLGRVKGRSLGEYDENTLYEIHEILKWFIIIIIMEKRCTELGHVHH